METTIELMDAFRKEFRTKDLTQLKELFGSTVRDSRRFESKVNEYRYKVEYNNLKLKALTEVILESIGFIPSL